jgi:hypothetical protein
MFKQFYKQPNWNNVVTICVDRRRVRYCAKQVKAACKVGTEPHRFAETMLEWLDTHHNMPEPRSAYVLERMYREIINKEQTSACS